MTIQTERLLLRAFVETDVSWYYDFLQNQDIKEELPGIYASNFKEAEQDILIFSRADFENDFYYLIMDKENKNVMGIIIAVRITTGTMDVSYFLKEEYRHNGYMHEALEAVISAACDYNPLYRFRFVIKEKNTASLNVIKKFRHTIEEVNGKYVCYI